MMGVGWAHVRWAIRHSWLMVLITYVGLIAIAALRRTDAFGWTFAITVAVLFHAGMMIYWLWRSRRNLPLQPKTRTRGSQRSGRKPDQSDNAD